MSETASTYKMPVIMLYNINIHKCKNTSPVALRL